ncbi:heterokaryon incompatibility protein-domain-containing protein [Astrocystis sublimbata]|nr:heterokaryon incompatibility protein-domain-containing protein [Astrocystis sublimbata]
METPSPHHTCTLSLLEGNAASLGIRIDADSGIYEHRLFLDLHLGNKEGKFDTQGRGFSRSAKNVRLVNNVLHASLKTSFGTWWDDQIIIETEVSDAAETPTINFQSYHFMRLKGCRCLRLIEDQFLACQILQPDNTYKEAWADLDGFLGNDNGAFSRHKTGFIRSSRNLRPVGSTLQSYLSNDGGRVVSYSSMRLTDFLEARGHHLKPLRNDIPKEFYDYERRWILLANCLMPNGIIRESAIKLSELSSPYWAIMHGDFDVPNTPSHVGRVKLEDGILTAYYVTNLKTFKRWQEVQTFRYEWAEKEIDLKLILGNEGGRLVLKPGSDCSRCSNMFTAGVFHNPFVMGATRRTLINTTAVGKKLGRKSCALCELLQATLKKCARGGYVIQQAWTENRSLHTKSFQEQPVLELVVEKTEKLGRFTFKTRVEEEPKVTQRFTILLEPGGNAYPCGGVPQHLRTIRQNSMLSYLNPQRRWNVVQSWITRYVIEHEDYYGKGDMELPSRFLEIADPHIVKVSTSIEGQKGRYACLSHCWGGKTPCTLTASTKEQFSESIPQSVMPRIFLETIGICRRLGIEKLWIDSLCIQQDSKEDWEYEAGRMCQYYSNCFVCIAATSSSSSTGTLAPVEHPADIVVRSNGHDPRTGPFGLVAIPSEVLDIHHFGRAHQKSDPSRFPLMTRAWVVQERWLSPRTLHFCGAEIVFECAQSTLCECGGEPQDVSRVQQGFVRAVATTRFAPVRENVDFHTWPDIVTEYSACDLSQPTDRLVALSGLASVKERRYLKHVPVESPIPRYLAGLWRDHLTYQLSWFVGEELLIAGETNRRKYASRAEPTRRRPKPQEYLAPSWSWASVMDPVHYLWFGDAIGEPLFELLSAHLPLASANPYGSVQEGCYLRINGTLLEISWKIGRHADGTESFILADVIGSQQLLGEDRRGISFSPDYLLTDLASSEQLVLLPLAKLDVTFLTAGIDDGDAAKASKTTMCLILRKVKGRSLGGLGDESMFERIGFTEFINFKNGVRNIDTNTYVKREVVII